MIKYRYNAAQKFIYINDDDQDLIPIQIWLPKPPKADLIKGYGLAPEKQKWAIPKIPDRLKRLEKNNGQPRSIDEIWQILENNPVKYAEEIKFIKLQWYHRLYGYWFYNNGTPTYITGKHYYYLCYYKLDVGAPQYRDRDRKYWLGIDFFENDTWDFCKKDKDGFAIPEFDAFGKKFYSMFDRKRLLCMGDVYPKFRREGATFRAQCHNLEVMSRTKNALSGIQSRDANDARKVFLKHLVPAFKKLPFFFKPLYSNSTDPKREIVFDKSSQSVTQKTGSISAIDSGLETSLTFGTGKEDDYDGWKLRFFHDDEIGKCVEYDVVNRNNITRDCMMESGRIIGYTSKTSTVGDMEIGGGDAFQTLCSQSNFYQRNENGMTASGLYVFFINSKEGYSLNEYGESDTEEAEKQILAIRKGKLDVNDLQGWNEEVRKFPLNYRECFTSTAAGMGFNIYKIEQRLNILRFTNLTRRGNFIRTGDINSRVVFNDDVNGRFVLSEVLSDQMANRKYMRDGVWFPANVKYIAGGDPFRMGETEGKKRSMGGGAVFKLHDELNDTGDIKNWNSNRFVCTYLYRTGTTDEYCNDMLMMCQYYGAMMFAESNVSHINDTFKKWGYGGYLLHAVGSDGKIRATPGQHSGENSKQELMLALANYIELHCEREMHMDLLLQCKEIPSIKKMTEYDLLTAAGLCIIGAEKGYWQHLEKKDTKSINIGDWIRVKMN